MPTSDVMEIKKCSGWECDICHIFYENETMAKNCCRKKKEVFICLVCDGEHKEREDAESCCHHVDQYLKDGASEIDGFQCWNCYRVHGEEKQAENCCKI